MKEVEAAIAAKSVASTGDGKRLLEYLSDYCYENRSTYVELNHDKQNINNGKRAVILEIRRLINMDTEKKPEPKKQTRYI